MCHKRKSCWLVLSIVSLQKGQCEGSTNEKWPSQRQIQLDIYDLNKSTWRDRLFSCFSTVVELITQEKTCNNRYGQIWNPWGKSIYLNESTTDQIFELFLLVSRGKGTNSAIDLPFLLSISFHWCVSIILFKIARR